jgi:hypothetical protein
MLAWSLGHGDRGTACVRVASRAARAREQAERRLWTPAVARRVRRPVQTGGRRAWRWQVCVEAGGDSWCTWRDASGGCGAAVEAGTGARRRAAGRSGGGGRPGQGRGGAAARAETGMVRGRLGDDEGTEQARRQAIRRPGDGGAQRGGPVTAWRCDGPRQIGAAAGDGDERPGSI